MQLLKALACLLLGHNYVNTVLTLGKLTQDNVNGLKCKRCNKVLLPVSEITHMQNM